MEPSQKLSGGPTVLNNRDISTLTGKTKRYIVLRFCFRYSLRWRYVDRSFVWSEWGYNICLRTIIEIL